MGPEDSAGCGSKRSPPEAGKLAVFFITLRNKIAELTIWILCQARNDMVVVKMWASSGVPSAKQAVSQ